MSISSCNEYFRGAMEFCNKTLPSSVSVGFRVKSLLSANSTLVVLRNSMWWWGTSNSNFLCSVEGLRPYRS